MNYEIVNLQGKTVVGAAVKTSNSDPKMVEIIGELWTKLYQGGVNEAIKNKLNDHAIGLYCDYTEDGYTVLAGNEVSCAENSELVQKLIPAGRYAKFSVHGNMAEAVGRAWGEIWQMSLDRSFTGDFEEYLNNSADEADIDIYVALKAI